MALVFILFFLCAILVFLRQKMATFILTCIGLAIILAMFLSHATRDLNIRL